ncbi:hypothetical protein BD289DRAFT_122343 [Coniella lustricola]|uniref:Uncharacterized protein n=1 Tax=Coniella lustricola TaxID=2025994 RepID=A0A2T2ZWF4_9PEZI|nr:hypothetical protein BD289DRAFT_122343 [Coniella lustricola]
MLVFWPDLMLPQPATVPSPAHFIPGVAVVATKHECSQSLACERSSTNTTATTTTPYATPGTASSTSKTTCISAPADLLLLLCSPLMEATKNLAQRLRHRASLRRTSKKTLRPGAAGSEKRLEADESERRESNTSNTSNAATSDDTPAAVTPFDDPPTAAAASPATAPLVTPLAPSPGSDVSPTTQQPPKLAINGAALESPSPPGAARSPGSGYFGNVPSPKITFAVPRELQDQQIVSGGSAVERDPGFPSLETAVSSTSQSSVVTSQGSNEDGMIEARRSSTGGQTRSSFNSRHRNSSTSIISNGSSSQASKACCLY